MKLFIDTSDRERIVIGFDNERFEEDARKEKSQALLPLIHEKLEKTGKSIHDVTEIEVAVGPGSFTGLRVGIAIANAIGWALEIPVNGKNIKNDGPIEPVYS